MGSGRLAQNHVEADSNHEPDELKLKPTTEEKNASAQ